MDEVSFALEEGKTVIPILYRECAIPFRLRRVQYLDFTRNYDAGLGDLLKTLPAEQMAQQQAPIASEEPPPVRSGDRLAGSPPGAKLHIKYPGCVYAAKMGIITVFLDGRSIATGTPRTRIDVWVDSHPGRHELALALELPGMNPFLTALAKAILWVLSLIYRPLVSPIAGRWSTYIDATKDQEILISRNWAKGCFSFNSTARSN